MNLIIYVLKKAHIGEILSDGQFKIIWSSEKQINPLPWLGLEESDLPNADLLIDLLAEVSEGIQYNWLLELKTLRSLIPICANCKKIRNDKGYWNQLEAYLANHSKVGFTHGICPECTKQLYPQFFNKQDINNSNPW